MVIIMIVARSVKRVRPRQEGIGLTRVCARRRERTVLDAGTFVFGTQAPEGARLEASTAVDLSLIRYSVLRW